MERTMDITNVKTAGEVFSFAILLIFGWTRSTRLQLNPTSDYIVIGRSFQQLLQAVNFQLNNITGLILNRNSVILSLLTGNLIPRAHPVSTDLNDDNITDKVLNRNFPVNNSPVTNLYQPAVISGLGGSGLI
jgi:hypothetical protein